MVAPAEIQKQKHRQVPVKASAFVKLPKDVQDVLIQSGAVPCNDVFFQYWTNRDKVLLFYGGYGSGKSVFFADMIIDRMLNDEYFRGFYGRKVFDTVRDSVFKTITDRIEQRSLKHLFTYSTRDNSSMRIHVKDSGNMLAPFGADKIEKLKSIKDPSFIYCEEMDQFSLDDFGVLLSRLRTQEAQTQLIGAFNTTAVKESHWLKQTFFSEVHNEEYAATKLFCNYTDNLFIDREEYEKTLWLSAAFDEQKFKEIASGAWGADSKDNAFIYAFRKADRTDRRPGYAHRVSGMKVDYNRPVYLSFDFNVEPITCTIWQHADDLSWISGIMEYRLLNSDIFELCERIRNDHPGAYFIVTGDASGKSRTAITRGNKNYYYFIREVLGLTTKQFILPTHNPSHSNTRVLANVIFEKHPAILINDSMQHLLADIDFVTYADGSIEKGKDKYKGHLFDTMLYYFWNFHIAFLKRFNIQLPKPIN